MSPPHLDWQACCEAKEDGTRGRRRGGGKRDWKRRGEQKRKEKGEGRKRQEGRGGRRKGGGREGEERITKMLMNYLLKI